MPNNLRYEEDSFVLPDDVSSRDFQLPMEDPDASYIDDDNDEDDEPEDEDVGLHVNPASQL